MRTHWSRPTSAAGEGESELRALLAATSPDGVFAERRRDIELEIWR